MKVDIRDVAKAAGVSIATVSRVLNDKDRVSPETRQRVRAAVEACGFMPDPVARSMIRKSTQAVGVLVPTLSNEFWAEVAEALQARLRSAGYTLMLSSLGGLPQSDASVLLKAMADRRMDGIILGGIELQDEDRALLKVRGVPVVGFDQEDGELACVGVDNRQAALDATRHLLSLGHRRIACVGVGREPDARMEGYRLAMRAADLKPLESLVLSDPDDLRCGYDACRSLLASTPGFTGLFCWNDLLAIGAINALRDAGLRTPQDVSVIGVDDIYMADRIMPRLTTMRQPVGEMGAAAVDMLLQRLAGDPVQDAERQRIFRMTLVERESCMAWSR